MIIKKRHEKTNKEAEKKQPESTRKEDPKINLFDLDNIDFAQRQERRRGNRRRGYRRIDDRNLISRAQEEAGSIRDNAAREGYQSGIEQAKKDLEQFRTAVGDFLNAKQEVFEYIAPDILEISIDIAKKIVKHEIEQDPQLILETILDILKTISKEEQKIVIKVNPSQVNFVKNSLPEIISLSGVEAKIRVAQDETIDTGGCIIETNNGVVDATINTQIEIIKEAFKGM